MNLLQFLAMGGAVLLAACLLVRFGIRSWFREKRLHLRELCNPVPETIDEREKQNNV